MTERHFGVFGNAALIIVYIVTSVREEKGGDKSAYEGLIIPRFKNEIVPPQHCSASRVPYEEPVNPVCTL